MPDIESRGVVRVIPNLVAAMEHRCGGSRYLFDAYAFPYRALVQRELRLAKVDRSETIMHIGCGSLPFTAVLAARLSGARVIAVDRDHAAVCNARRVVRRLGLTGHGGGNITIIHAEAGSDDLPRADVVLVALQATGKRAILDNIARTTGASRVVFRLPRPGLEADYGTLGGVLEPAGVCRHRMPTFDRSALYRISGRTP